MGIEEHVFEDAEIVNVKVDDSLLFGERLELHLENDYGTSDGVDMVILTRGDVIALAKHFKIIEDYRWNFLEQ